MQEHAHKINENQRIAKNLRSASGGSQVSHASHASRASHGSNVRASNPSFVNQGYGSTSGGDTHQYNTSGAINIAQIGCSKDSVRQIYKQQQQYMSASSACNTGGPFGGGYASNINMNTTATSGGGNQHQKSSQGASSGFQQRQRPGASPVENILSSSSHTNLAAAQTTCTL
jgi:hypothetical protein